MTDPSALPRLGLIAEFESGGASLEPYGYDSGFTVERGLSSIVTTGFVSDASTFSTLLDNISRDLDPNNLAGPFVTAGVSDVVPGVGVEAFAFVGLTGYEMFVGTADAWPQDYPAQGVDQEVQLHATDVLADLAAAQLSLQRPSEYSGARIQAILDDFGYTGPTSIAHGNSIIGPLRFTTVSALSHINDVVMAEWGEFYVASDNTLTFRDRDQILSEDRSMNPQAELVQTPGVNYIDIQMGSPEIVNEVVVVYSDSGKQVTVRNGVSIAAPWSRGIPKTKTVTVPLSNAAQARAYGRWILRRYAFPITTFTSVTIDPLAAPDPDVLWEMVLTRELCDLVNLTLDPLSAPYTPSGDPIVRDCWIRGIRHDWQEEPWTTTWYLQDASWRTGLWHWDVSEWDGADVWGL